MHVLNETVQERIEASNIEKRDEKLWLVKDLEMMRQLILEDLRVIKTLCVPCFPPDYQILNEYVKMYHRAVSGFVSIFKFSVFSNSFKIPQIRSKN
jgi:exocyst complex component 3